MAKGILKNKTRLVRAGAATLMLVGLGGFVSSVVGMSSHSIQRDAISEEISSLRIKASLTEGYIRHKQAGMDALADSYKMGVMKESEYNNYIDQLNSKDHIEDYIINYSDDKQLRDDYVNLTAVHDKEQNKVAGCAFGWVASFGTTVVGAGLFRNSYDEKDDENDDEMLA